MCIGERWSVVGENVAFHGYVPEIIHKGVYVCNSVRPHIAPDPEHFQVLLRVAGGRRDAVDRPGRVRGVPRLVYGIPGSLENVPVVNFPVTYLNDILIRPKAGCRCHRVTRTSVRIVLVVFVSLRVCRRP